MVNKTALSAAALAALGLTALWLHRAPEPTPAPLAVAPAEEPSQLQREARARFKNSKPRIRLPDGSQIEPSNEAHADAIRLRAYENILVREEEERDPAFRLKAEAELSRRRPLHATLRWEDLSGNREAVFVVEDSSHCDLGEEDSDFQVSQRELGHYACLNQLGELGQDAVLSVQTDAVKTGEPLYDELLRSTMRGMAAEAHLARTKEDEAI